MSDTPANEQHVRRVVLPSGKTIEVVYFEGHPDAPAAPAPRDTETQLHVCGSCASQLVYPIAWDEAGSEHWEVTLRCPECEWSGTGVFEQHAVERFDEVLDRGTEAVVSDLRRLVQANLEEEIERFVQALAVDAILPEDFAS